MNQKTLIILAGLLIGVVLIASYLFNQHSSISDGSRDMNKRLLRASKGAKWGFIDEAGQWVIQPKFTMAQDFEKDVARVVVDRSWGLIDKNGQYIAKPQYRLISKFNDGMACVRIGDGDDSRMGYIDQSGKLVIEPKYVLAEPFSEGLAYVLEAGEDWTKFESSYVDTMGRTIGKKMGIRRGQPFSEGLAAVVVNGKGGYIDTTGKLAIQAKYDFTYPFRQGLAKVAMLDEKKKASPDNIPPDILDSALAEVIAYGVYGLIDRTGRAITEIKYDEIEPFAEGLAVVTKDQRSGFMDTTGTMVIAMKFSGALAFSDGLAAACLDGKWGFIDKHGKAMVDFQYEATAPFADGLAGVKRSGKWGFIDRTGKMIIKPQFDKVQSFANGVAPVALKAAPDAAAQQHMIDGFKGSMQTGPNAEDVGGQVGQKMDQYMRAMAERATEVKWGLIDATGKTIAPPQYFNLQALSEGIYLVVSDRGIGYIDRRGKVILEPGQ